MTSPALIVLFLAHVCSIFGTASEKTADHDHRLANMRTHTEHRNRWTNYINIDRNNKHNVDNIKTHDYIYADDSELAENLEIHRMNVKRLYRDEPDMGQALSLPEDAAYKSKMAWDTSEHWQKKEVSKDTRLRRVDDTDVAVNRVRRQDVHPCTFFYYNERIGRISHPHAKENKTYSRNINCVTVINATENQVIQLTFVDEFRIENHPDCAYDYLEIRDGLMGYSDLLGKVCGQTFPRQMTTSGPHAWLKFHSDDTIEYEGFHIAVEFKNAPSHRIPDACYIPLKGKSGPLDLANLNNECSAGTTSQGLDVLWTITVPKPMKIYLNFTTYKLVNPNECEKNLVEVYGAVLEVNARIMQFCGSIANSVSTKESSDDPGNIMHVRVYVLKEFLKQMEFSANFTAYRQLDPVLDTDKCGPLEFDCDDNTCIDSSLVCDNYGNCRLKTDEDSCSPPTVSTIRQPHIMAILIIFSLILSTMSAVFFFKCIRKLYQDHKIIKEHIRQSCEDRLDTLVGSRLTLDAKRLQSDSEPRASLERENHANEMFKRKRDSYSKRKPTSIDSDYIQETHLDVDDDHWRREVERFPVQPDDIRIERNGRTRRSERKSESKKEDSIRSKRESEEKEKKEIRDVSVGTPDTKESGCQTRESLFQADPPPSSDGSNGTNSRGFSTFGYSGATIARPSPPATKTSEITIELLRQMPRQDTVKPQKKIDRRPISAETTRSAPDVIIVSKPIR